jgi:hypothetical protein
MSRTVSIIVYCFVASIALAQTDPALQDPLIWIPPLPLLKLNDSPEAQFPKATVPKEMIPTVRISTMNIVLDKTELEEVQARFGGEKGVKGDAADSLEWLCLHGTDAVGPWALWLYSGEMNGPTIGGFLWQRVPATAQFDRRCQMLGEADSNVAPPLGICLGTSEAKLLQVLGKPTLRKGDVLLYQHEHERTIRNETITFYNTVTVGLRHGAVQAIDGYKEASN